MVRANIWRMLAMRAHAIELPIIRRFTADGDMLMLMTMPADVMTFVIISRQFCRAF